MAFTLQTWREEIQQQWRHLGGRLRAVKERYAPHLVYGTLCGMAVWPLVEAMQQGQTTPTLMTLGVALGSVAGSVGANLLAEQVQRWKEGADRREVDAWLAEHAAQDADLRAALDEIVEKLDAIPPPADVSLSEDDRAWFAQTLRQELTQIGNWPRFERVIDQRWQHVDHQVNVVGNYIACLYQVYQTAPGQMELDDAAFRKVLTDYLGWVIREYGYTRLHGLQSLQETGPLKTELARVYTSLTVRKRPAVVPGGDMGSEPHSSLRKAQRDDAGEPQPLDMADLLPLGERVAIVGGAGSGKTTYLAFVAVALAAALTDQPLDTRLKPPADDAPLPVPLLAPLRFWQVYRDECAQSPGRRLRQPDEGSLGRFLIWFLRARYKNFAAAGDFFDRLLRGGRGCLIMLDGMDEVVNADERRVVRDGVEHLLGSQYPGNRCLVTARQSGYRDAPFGSDFVRCDVQPMNQQQITRLLHAWCQAIYAQPDDRRSVCDELAAKIKAMNADRIQRAQDPLVASPLMTTMVVSVKYSRRDLPRERAKLYDACVDVILKGEYSGSEDDAGARKRLVRAGGDPDKQREWLSLLAFHMQQGGQAGISLDDVGLRDLLGPVFRERGEQPMLGPFLEATQQRGGLLDWRGGRYQFLHLTFQEYLAAQYLSRQWPGQPVGLLAQVAADEWWRETLLLTVGSLGAPEPFDRRRCFVEALCTLAANMDAKLAAAELAATGLKDLTDPEPPLLDIAHHRLSELIRSPELVQARPTLRAAAGNALAVLGDDRDFDQLVAVPPGPFWMGSDDGDEDERPRHQVTLPAFRIGKYPVTNAQYERFVETTGRQWGWEAGLRRERATHPAVAMTWYDAVAYCAWLSDIWRAEARIAPDEVVRLPSESEWEKAARGTDGRAYPWGEWAEGRCNIGDLGLGDTTPVGIFPDGASPYGCLDMAGNVWEWTLSLWGEDYEKPDFKYPYVPGSRRESQKAGNKVLRAIRGGAWYYSRSGARCACRYRGAPDGGGWVLGFRVVVSPISLVSGL